MKLCLIQLTLCASVGAFAPIAKPSSTTSKLSMINDESSRRSFFDKIVGSSAVVGLTLLQSPVPANAIGGGIKKVNAKLARLV